MSARYLMRNLKKTVPAILVLAVIGLMCNISIIKTEGEEEYCRKVNKVMEENNGLPKVNSPDRNLFNVEGEKHIYEEGTLQIKKRPYANCLEQTDPFLIKLVNSGIVEPNQLDYNMSFPRHCLPQVEEWFSPWRESVLAGGRPCTRHKCHTGLEDGTCLKIDSHTMADYIDEAVFKRRKREGYFVESGAFDGDLTSVSLIFEIRYGWTGILIEPIPDPFMDLLTKNRRALHVNNCLATGSRPHIAELAVSQGRRINKTGRLVMSSIIGKDETIESDDDKIKMQCWPFYSILEAAGNPVVNLWILDIEGAEFPVLRSIPWDLVEIEVILVETSLAGVFFPGKREDILEFLKSKGYTHLHHFENDSSHDDLLVSEKAMEKYKPIENLL